MPARQGMSIVFSLPANGCVIMRQLCDTAAEMSMKFQVIDSLPHKTSSDCIVVGVTPDGMTANARSLNKACKGAIQKALGQGDIKGNAGESLYLYGMEGIKSPRILVLGCGNNDKRNADCWTKMMETAFSRLNGGGSKNAAIFLNDVKVRNRRFDWMLQEAARTMCNAGYLKGEMKSTFKKPSKSLGTAKFYVGRDVAVARRALSLGKAIGEGMALTRRLGDLPANVATPAYLAGQVRALGRKFDRLNVKVLNEARMKKLGMGSLLSVSAGSVEPAQLIVLEYQGGKPSAAPIALVGKGVTFDSGGISLKPGAAMDEMKYDMCGAAAVLGTLQAAASLKLPINVVGVVPVTENMPGGRATKPGDIVTSMSGKTIEILNTDAEGRLILCDALTYAQRYAPDVIIDIATLTGAVIVALGNHISAVMGNDDRLVGEITDAGNDAQDKVWQLPIDDRFQQQLESNFADMANIGGRGAGAITAACFLARYTEDVSWAHIDIAGTAWKSGGKTKGASGRPVPLLTQFLINRCS